MGSQLKTGYIAADNGTDLQHAYDRLVEESLIEDGHAYDQGGWGSAGRSLGALSRTPMTRAAARQALYDAYDRNELPLNAGAVYIPVCADAKTRTVNVKLTITGTISLDTIAAAATEKLTAAGKLPAGHTVTGFVRPEHGQLPPGAKVRTRTRVEHDTTRPVRVWRVEGRNYPTKAAAVQAATSALELALREGRVLGCGSFTVVPHLAGGGTTRVSIEPTTTATWTVEISEPVTDPTVIGWALAAWVKC